MSQASILSFFTKSGTTQASLSSPLTSSCQPTELGLGSESHGTCVQNHNEDTVPDERSEATNSTDSNTLVPFPTQTDWRIPSLVSICRVETVHLPALRTLTTSLLPVKYPESFFTGAVEDEEPAAFSRVALYDSKAIGWIRCRVDPLPDNDVVLSTTKPLHKQIYIQALCLLAPYRGQGIAIALLDDILRNEDIEQRGIGSILAHVWEANETALEWYEKRGFRKAMLVEQYYRKLRPQAAWIMQRTL